MFIFICFIAQNTRLEVSWDQVDAPHPEQTSQGHILSLLSVLRFSPHSRVCVEDKQLPLRTALGSQSHSECFGPVVALSEGVAQTHKDLLSSAGTHFRPWGCRFGDTSSVEQEAHLALCASLCFHITLLTTGPGFYCKKRGMTLHISIFCEFLQVALVAVNIIGDPADYGINSMSIVSPKHPCPFTGAPFLQVQVPGVMG